MFTVYAVKEIEEALALGTGVSLCAAQCLLENPELAIIKLWRCFSFLAQKMILMDHHLTKTAQEVIKGILCMKYSFKDIQGKMLSWERICGSTWMRIFYSNAGTYL